ncbi:Lrp/AsnC family transcriptional regulator [Weeksellaceae bacterium A-14]|uniref:Lrp/AsnC family transcriptional regulator n=1 Tax=Daejeonia sp. YH14 TaxID=3439042 RepID=UPI0031E4DCD2
MKPLDSIDRNILNILQEDSTIAVKDIAEQVGLSFTPTYERIKSLKQRGVIEKSAVIVNREAVGYSIMAYCNIVLKEQSQQNLMIFEEKIRKETQVLEVVSMSGMYDYMIKVIARDINDYNRFMTDIVANIPNIGQYHSAIVLSVVKDETKITL